MTAFRADAERVAALIATARRLLAAGKTVDLTALEGRVRNLCEGLAGNPPPDPDDRLEARALLGHLARDLDGLEHDLARLPAEIRPPPPRHRAARAYESLGGRK